MTNLKYAFLLFLLFMASCHEQKNALVPHVKEIDFNAKESGSPEMTLECSYLSLETNDSCLIGGIGAIQETDSFLLVLNTQDDNLLVFDKKGHWITQVGQSGNGPGEYLTATSFFIDSNKKRVAVIDDEQKKILYYALPHFTFMEEMRFPSFVSSNCIKVENGLVWYNEAFEGNALSDYYFFTTDTSGEVKNRFVEKEFKSGYLTGATYMLYECGGDVYGYPPYDMTVYRLSMDSAVPVYHFNVEGHTTPTLDFLNKTSNGGKSSGHIKQLSESDYISYYDVVETDGEICVNYIINKMNFVGFYDKSRNKSYAYSLNSLADSFRIGQIRYFIPQSIDGNFLAVLDVAALKELEAEGYEFNPELAAILKQSDAESNPILLKIKSRCE